MAVLNLHPLRQGRVAYSNFAVTVLWILNVIAIWLPDEWQKTVKIKIFELHDMGPGYEVLLSRLQVIRTDTGSVIGYAFAAALVIAFIVSRHERAGASGILRPELEVLRSQYRFLRVSACPRGKIHHSC